MTKVYLVSRGSYSDYSIKGIFSTRKNAQAMIDAYADADYYSMNDSIEAFELDSNVEHYRKGECVWFLWMNRDGSLEHAPEKWPYEAEGLELCKPLSTRGSSKTMLRVIIFALSAEHAVKIANDRRAQLIANNEWPAE